MSVLADIGRRAQAEAPTSTVVRRLRTAIGSAAMISAASRPAPAAARKTIVYAAAAGNEWPSTCMIIPEAMAAVNALQDEVPSMRIRELRLLAAAVSVDGTASMIRIGIAE